MDFHFIYHFGKLSFLIVRISYSILIGYAFSHDHLFRSSLLFTGLLFILNDPYSIQKKVLVPLPIPSIRLARTLWFVHAVLPFLIIVISFGIGMLAGWMVDPGLTTATFRSALVSLFAPICALFYLMQTHAWLALVSMNRLHNSIFHNLISPFVMFAVFLFGILNYAWLENLFGNWMWALVFLALVAVLTYCRFMNSRERLQNHWLQPMQRQPVQIPTAGKPDRITHPVWRRIRTNPLGYACFLAWACPLVYAGLMAIYLHTLDTIPESSFLEIFLLGPLGASVVSLLAYYFVLPYLYSLRIYAVLPLSRGRLVRNCLLLPVQLLTPYFLVMALLIWVMSPLSQPILESPYGYYFSLYVLTMGSNMLAYAMGMTINPIDGFALLVVILVVQLSSGGNYHIYYRYSPMLSNGIVLGVFLFVWSGIWMWEVLTMMKMPFLHNYERVAEYWSKQEVGR